MRPSFPTPAKIAAVAFLTLLAAVPRPGAGQTQVEVETRVKATLALNGQKFRDLDANGVVDPYEDWRVPVELRVEDLLSRMTLQEKVGMMLINTLNADAGGRLPERGVRLIEEEKMTRFIFRNEVTAEPAVVEARGPLAGAQTDEAPVRLYTPGMDPEVVGDERWGGYTVTAGDAGGGSRAPVPRGTDYAIVRVEVSNEGARPDLFFGGANPDELDLLAFSDMATADSWKVFPSLEEIQQVMAEIGPARTVLAVYFRQPYMLDAESGLRQAGGILATFGVRDAAIMDVLTGRHAPQGKLPFALANSAHAIVEQAPDAPGYDPEDTLFPFGFGLTY